VVHTRADGPARLGDGVGAGGASKQHCCCRNEHDPAAAGDNLRIATPKVEKSSMCTSGGDCRKSKSGLNVIASVNRKSLDVVCPGSDGQSDGWRVVAHRLAPVGDRRLWVVGGEVVGWPLEYPAPVPAARAILR
jgi:hypothetical protein